MSALPQASARLGLFGYFGSGNFGNDASLLALHDRLTRSYAEAEMVCICREPGHVTDLFGIPAVSMATSAGRGGRRRPWTRAAHVAGKLLDPLWLLAVVRRLDAVVVPGMGVFEEQIGVRPWGLPYTLFCLSLACRVSGTSLAFVSVGSEPVQNPVTRRFYRWAAQQSVFCSYRDEYSRAAMVSNGATNPATVAPDLVFSEPPSVTTPVRREKTVSVGLMEYFGPTNDRTKFQHVHDAYVARMVDVVKQLRAQGYVVRLLSGDKVDEAVADRVSSLATSHVPADAGVEIVRVETMQELLDAMAGSSVVIGSRFHNVIAAILLHLPVISLGYGEKHAQLIAEAEHLKLTRHITAFTAQWVIDCCETLTQDGGAAQLSLTDYCENARVRLEEQHTALLKALGQAEPAPAALTV